MSQNSTKRSDERRRPKGARMRIPRKSIAIHRRDNFGLEIVRFIQCDRFDVSLVAAAAWEEREEAIFSHEI